MSMLAQPLAYTVEEVAAGLRVSKRTVHRKIKSGELPAVRIGRAVRIPADALARLLETTSEQTPTEKESKHERENPQLLAQS